MSNRDAAVAALVLAFAVSAGANTATAEDAAKAAEAAAAMERAKRQAAGPLRFILEASKGRRKPGEPDAAAPAAETKEAPVVARVASSGAAARALTVTSLAQPSAPVAAQTQAAPAAAGNPNLVSEISYNAELRSKATSPVPALDTSGAAEVALPVRSLVAALPLAALAAAPVQPRLVSRVDPDLTQRMLDDMGPNRVMFFDLSLRANGSVSAVNPVGAVPRSLQRALVTALEQWRFEPLPAAHVHRVEVVFNNDR